MGRFRVNYGNGQVSNSCSSMAEARRMLAAAGCGRIQRREWEPGDDGGGWIWIAVRAEANK